MGKNNSRREFIKSVAAGTAGAGVALGTSKPAYAGIAYEKDSPSDRVRVGVMGTNGRGTSLSRTFARTPGSEVAYVCDVDERAIAKADRAVQETGAKAPQGVKDFRHILDDPSIDALVIAAPDHWHAPASILACAAGKHVYVEKPCSHNPREGELMVAAARRYDRVVQLGTQRRSSPTITEAIEQIQGGLIGKVYYSRSRYANTRGSIGHGKPARVPSWLDYELWQGPAPRREFRDNLIHYNWHWFWNWGTGEAGNNGVHSIDLSRWGLEVDYPVRVTSAGGRYRWKDDQETPDTQVLAFEFAGGKSLTWEGLSCNRDGTRGSAFRATFHGENGTVGIAGGGYTVFDKDGRKVKEVNGGSSRDPTSLHIANFLDCLRTGKRPHADIEEGHKSTLLCHLGNIAQRTGHTLNCDGKNGHVLKDKKAMQLWSRDYEAGWEASIS